MVLDPVPTAFLGELSLLHLLVILAAITSGVLATLGLMAFARRRSAPYLLVALALVLLLGKATIGLLSLGGFVSFEVHNLIEHGLDFLVATLLLGAIAEARRPSGCRLGRWLGLGIDR